MGWVRVAVASRFQPKNGHINKYTRTHMSTIMHTACAVLRYWHVVHVAFEKWHFFLLDEQIRSRIKFNSVKTDCKTFLLQSLVCS